jgi:hypothetical protein
MPHRFDGRDIRQRVIDIVQMLVQRKKLIKF